MLNESQKAKRRLLIQDNPQLDYIDNILGDDDFALGEIAVKVPIMLENKQGAVQQHLEHQQYLETQLAKLYSEIEILTNSGN